MAFVVHSKKLAAKPHWVSVTGVFKESSDTPFLKAAGVTSMDDPRYDKYTSRLKQLRAIRDYGYRVHVLERDKSYEEVTEIFVRVNSLGAKLGLPHRSGPPDLLARRFPRSGVHAATSPQ